MPLSSKCKQLIMSLPLSFIHYPCFQICSVPCHMFFPILLKIVSLLVPIWIQVYSSFTCILVIVYNHTVKMFCCLCDQPTVGKEQSSVMPHNRDAQIAHEDGTRTSCGRTSARSVLVQRQHLQITAQVSQTANVRVLSQRLTLLG